MAREIKPTPVLRGRDARRFLKHLENPSNSNKYHTDEELAQQGIEFMKRFIEAAEKKREQEQS